MKAKNDCKAQARKTAKTSKAAPIGDEMFNLLAAQPRLESEYAGSPRPTCPACPVCHGTLWLRGSETYSYGGVAVFSSGRCGATVRTSFSGCVVTPILIQPCSVGRPPTLPEIHEAVEESGYLLRLTDGGHPILIHSDEFERPGRDDDTPIPRDPAKVEAQVDAKHHASRRWLEFLAYRAGMGKPASRG